MANMRYTDHLLPEKVFRLQPVLERTTCLPGGRTANWATVAEIST